MVACSARHTLVLTTLGLVYSCGDNTEGALGSGDVDSRQQLQVLSQWYSSVTPTSTDGTHPEPKLADNPPIIVKIAAAAGIIGSHSVALDEHGNLYSWGVAQATGHGVMKPVLSPRQIDTFPVPQSASKVRTVFFWLLLVSNWLFDFSGRPYGARTCGEVCPHLLLHAWGEVCLRCRVWKWIYFLRTAGDR